MKTKRIYLLLLLLCFLCCSLAGCKKNKKDDGKTPDVTEQLPEESIAFINKVNNLVISFEAYDEIEEAFQMFDALEDGSWEFVEVLEAYSLLEAIFEYYNNLLTYDSFANDFIRKVEAIPFQVTLAFEYLVIGARNTYLAMPDNAKEMLGVEIANEKLCEYEEIIKKLTDEVNLQAAQAAAATFVNLCLELKEASLITLEDEEVIKKCLAAYDELPEEAKELTDVILSYQKLSSCKERYDYIVEHPEINENIKKAEFINLVSEISDPVTLADITTIKKAESAYLNLASNLIEASDVIDAHQLLLTARQDYNQLYVAYLDEVAELALNQAANAFITAVNQIKTPITKDEGLQIQMALRQYRELPFLVKEISGVDDSYQNLLNYQNAFNNLDLEKLEAILLNINASSSENPNVTFEQTKTLLYPKLLERYNVQNVSQLTSYCDLVLLIYQINDKNTPVLEVVVNELLINNSEELSASQMINYLEVASTYHENLTAGVFRLGLRVEDKTGQYQNSDIFKSIVNFTYNFTSRYHNEETGIKKISSVGEFLAIKNDLNAHYQLINNLDLSEIAWVNLGIFNGTLDGNGYTISGLNCSKGPDSAFGIFLEITKNGLVCNLKITGDVENAGSYAGLIAVRNYGTIRNCYLDVKMRSLGITDQSGSNSGDACIGGIVAENFGLLENIIVMSDILGAGTKYGSLDGMFCIGNSGTIKACYALKGSTEVVIGNNSTNMLETLKTENELKIRNLYHNFDISVWEIVEGFIPELINYEA